MTVHDHPARVRAVARGDQAERLIQVALDLALLVRDEGPGATASFLDRLTAGDRYRLLTVLAALIPVDHLSKADLLSWVTWDEFGKPLDGTAPVLPGSTSPDDFAADHGDWAAYCRHMRAGERDKAALEACGCAEAARVYTQERRKARRQTEDAAPVTADEAAAHRADLERELRERAGGRRRAA